MRRVMKLRRGAVLIVVLGVLAVLSLLATTFATLQATERSVARNYLDTVRAKLLAQSGIQDAEARLAEYFPAHYFDGIKQGVHRPWKFWGRDKTETVEPPAQERLEEAVNPSFAVEKEAVQDPTDPQVEPRTVRIDGKERGASGFVSSGTYALNGDHYVLKVSDLSGRLYVNDGLDGDTRATTPAKLGSVSQNLKRMLNVLGDVLKVPELGNRILSARPPAGYRQTQDLLRAVGYDETVYNRFKDYVTVHAWIDPNVALPVPLSPAATANYPVAYASARRFGSSLDCAGKECVPSTGLATCPSVPHDHPAIRVYGLDTLNPQWIEIVSRAPVNVNAAPREVLVAVFTDLRGFFLADRRRNNPRWKGDMYISVKQTTTFSSAGTEGDEIGFLMETMPIAGPGGTGAGSISAYELADEIIACRNRKASRHFNYSAVDWGGPFRTWNQFNHFVDNLARPKAEGGAGLLEDTRPLHFDYEEETDDPTGHGALVPSEMQKRHASRAIADVLKANFNPNLHLNEANPDENLYLRVDKTDLIVNSTEFCFLPTGYFEVESLGRVVRPKDPAVRDAYRGENELIAQAKVTASFKFYDLYRETHQRHFLAGFYEGHPGGPSPRAGAFETNSGYSLEAGPEPDNGVWPGNFGDTSREADNEWGGYVSLPSVGGPTHDAPLHPKNTLERTPAGTSQFGESMHVHFAQDTDAHYHVGDRQDLATRRLPQEAIENYPDSVGGRPLSYGGPYDPTDGVQPGPSVPIHRLARSFRQKTMGEGRTRAAQSLEPYAPSDLRIDGIYSERHAAPAYATGESIWHFSTEERGSGMVSFWLKPSFFPELTGKVRGMWDLGRYHTPCNAGVYLFPFAMWFFPAHYNAQVAEAGRPMYFSNAIGHFHPASIVMGSVNGHYAGGLHYPHQFGKITASLNHLGHPDETAKPSPLRAHRWMHVAFSWHLTDRLDFQGQSSKLYVNGSNSPIYVPFGLTTYGWGELGPKLLKWDRHDGEELNHMRLGAPSKIAEAAVVSTQGGVPGAFRGNHSSDFTLDELYVWKTALGNDPLTLWLRGRYYAPRDKNAGEGVFTSKGVALWPSVRREPPPASRSAPPGVAGTGSPSGNFAAPNVRVLGVSWTWYGESLDPQGRPILLDYNTPLGVGGRDMKPQVRVGIQDGPDGAVYGPFEDDGFSSVRDREGAIPVLRNPGHVKYVVDFSLAEADAGTVLLATPVFDDVTIYYDAGGSRLLSYVFDTRSF